MVFVGSLPNRVRISETRVFRNLPQDRMEDPVGFGIHVSWSLGKAFDKACESLRQDLVPEWVNYFTFKSKIRFYLKLLVNHNNLVFINLNLIKRV